MTWISIFEPHKIVNVQFISAHCRYFVILGIGLGQKETRIVGEREGTSWRGEEEGITLLTAAHALLFCHITLLLAGLSVILWWASANPICIPKLKSLASVVAEILWGNSKISGSSPSPRPRPLFFCVWFYDGACGPSCVPNFKSLASAVAEILDGNPQIFGSSTSQGLRPLFLWVWFCDGPWQTPAACKI